MLGLFTREIGVDLGTTSTLILVRGEGIVMREPSVVALRSDDKQAVAVGAEALAMMGRAPGEIIAFRPLKDGVIADLQIAALMLKTLLRRVIRVRGRFMRTRAVICVPGEISGVERMAVEEAAHAAGAHEVWLLQEPLAAAMGAKLPVEQSVGSMVVDIGGGTTEIAVVSLGGIVLNKSLRCGGNHMDDAITAHLRKEHHVIIGESAAEQVKIHLGGAKMMDEGSMTVRGRDATSGLPVSQEISSQEIFEALHPCVNTIREGVREVLEQTPPELAGDLLTSGIVLTGGGALLRSLDTFLAEDTNLPVVVAENAADCVANGTEWALSSMHVPRKPVMSAAAPSA